MRLGALLALLLWAPIAAAHAGHGVGQDLVSAGKSLMVGRAESALPGPLVVVPRGTLGCDGAAAGYLLPLDADAGVAFVANDTDVEARLDLPPGARAFAAVALDTGGAVRALVGMQEEVERIHRARALVLAGPDGGVRARNGTLGEAPPSAHAGSGLNIAYDEPPANATTCPTDPPGHARFLFPRDAARVVHAVALYDPEVAQFLPRPLDATRVLQANLYVAEPGEDAATIRAALAGGAPVDTIPLAAAGAGVALLLVVRRAPA